MFLLRKLTNYSAPHQEEKTQRLLPDETPQEVNTSFTPLHSAAAIGKVDELQKMLVSKKHNVNSLDSLGRTALTMAIINQNEAAAKLLLDHNANLNLAKQYLNEQQMNRKSLLMRLEAYTVASERRNPFRI